MRHLLIRAVTGIGATAVVSATLMVGTAVATPKAPSTCTGTRADASSAVIRVNHAGGGSNSYSFTGGQLEFPAVGGDTITAVVTLKPGCSETISAASFIAPTPEWHPELEGQQVLFQAAQANAKAGVPTSLTVTLPPAYTTSSTGGSRGAGCTNTHPAPTSNGPGANAYPGPYDSTCDGSASQNGVGSGQANGKPCAGCVGNADYKNPPGQMPNGSDPNAGYECDRNQGVGQTNPAHSGCTGVQVPQYFQYDLAVGPVQVPPSYGNALIATSTPILHT